VSLRKEVRAMTILKTPVSRCASVFVFAGEPVVPASYLFLQKEL